MRDFNFTEKNDTRSGFGDALTELGKTNPNVVALCADLIGSLKMNDFVKNHPERFIQTGIAEANMIGIAAGLATTGKIPFAGTFAVFAAGRTYDQIRLTAAYSNKNIKIAASHSGISVGEDGASHQMIEDLALMRALPNMVVINTCDYNQTKAATFAAAEYYGPVYLRFGRPKLPVYMPTDIKFEIGKAIVLNEGTDVTIIATGHPMWESIQATKMLEEKGLSVDLINIHTIKPIDAEAIIKSAKKTNAVVTVEEHSIYGGLGDAVANVLAHNYPVPVEMVGIKDTFGESGTTEELYEKYGLMPKNIVEAALKSIERKKH
ncbi:MAG: transketolase family protein [Bacteroidales bacterium]|nr:transketolase family protein [Bacteroidales bacterium]